jgi:DNA-binding MarR family transcriptional regulator
MYGNDDRQHAVNRADPATAGSPSRTAAGDGFSELVVRIFRLNGLLASAGDALARPAGQTSARWQVLAMIEDGDHTVAETARTLGLARQSVQRVADLLEAEGLVVYTDNPRHRRARLLRLTNAGRSALAQIQAGQRPWANEAGARIGESRLRRLNADLDVVLARLDEDRRRGRGAQPRG